MFYRLDGSDYLFVDWEHLDACLRPTDRDAGGRLCGKRARAVAGKVQAGSDKARKLAADIRAQKYGAGGMSPSSAKTRNKKRAQAEVDYLAKNPAAIKSTERAASKAYRGAIRGEVDPNKTVALYGRSGQARNARGLDVNDPIKSEPVKEVQGSSIKRKLAGRKAARTKARKKAEVEYLASNPAARRAVEKRLNKQGNSKLSDRLKAARSKQKIEGELEWSDIRGAKPKRRR